MEKRNLKQLKEMVEDYRQDCKKRRKGQRIKVKYNWAINEVTLFGMYLERHSDSSIKEYKDKNSRGRVAPLYRSQKGPLFGSMAIAFLFGMDFVMELNNTVNGSGQISLNELDQVIDQFLVN